MKVYFLNWAPHRGVRLLLSLVVVCGLLIGGAGQPAHPAYAADDLPIYTDALAGGWQNWSYNSTIDLANATPAYGDTGASVAVTVTSGYGALQFGSPTAISTTDYTAVSFKVYGATGGSQLQSYVSATSGGAASPSVTVDAPAGVWTPITIPLAQLGNPATVQIIAIQDRTGAAQPTFYVDDVKLVAGAEPPPPPPPPVNEARKVRDLDVFTGKPNGSYVYSGGGLTIESSDSFIPLDTTETHNGQPSYRFAVTGPSGYWGAGIARGWLTYSLKNYWQYSFLEFYIKGAQGGEQFDIALFDRTYERTTNGGRVSIDMVTSLARYATVTTEWQRVKIPVRDIIPADSGFFLDGAQVVQFRGASPATFWVADIRFTANVNEPSFPAIKVNQLGYTTKAEKYALVSGFADELTADAGTAFTVKQADTGAEVYRGALTLVNALDDISGEKVLKADFSSLTAPGSYVIAVDAQGIENSPAFAIGDDVYANLVKDAARYFYYQRSGIALNDANAGQWKRGEGHPQDRRAILRSSTLGPNPITKTLDVSGGWYDAGDYGRYVSFADDAVSDLLWAYETFPNVFKNQDLNIPESGNRIPDVLDEVRWELDWVMKMQDRNTGGFYHMIYPNNPPESDTYTTTQQTMPDKHMTARYVEDCEFQSYNQTRPELSVVGPGCKIKPTADTGSAVAMLAHGATVFKRLDPRYAAKLLAAALYGWSYLERNPQQINIPGQNGGIDADRDQRLWAAAELYRLTGASRFDRYVLDHYQEPQFTKWWTSTTDSAFIDDGTQSMRAMLAYMQAPRRNPQVVQWFETNYAAYRQIMLQRQQSLTWRNFLLGKANGVDSDYFWGSNAVTLQIPIVLIVGGKLTNSYDDSIVAATRANLNYILGINPLRKSYVSGYGADSIREIYSFIYSWDGLKDIPPGYIAGGPNKYENGVYSRFDGKAWADTDTNWAANENAIYWNSVLIFNAAAVADAAGR
jgi:hypothetical protein